MVRAAGIEPAWGCPRGILSPLRLPVPPCPLNCVFESKVLHFALGKFKFCLIAFWLVTQKPLPAYYLKRFFKQIATAFFLRKIDYG
jgi:hypothetical protein